MDPQAPQTSPQAPSTQLPPQAAGPAERTGAPAPVAEKTAEVQWYYSKRGASYGPVTEHELAALARAGEFARHDTVYGTHIGQWVRADGVHGLFDGAGTDDSAAAVPLRVPPRQEPPLPDEFLRPAGFWVRAWADLVDMAFVGFLLFAALVSAMPAGWLRPAAQRLARAVFSGDVRFAAALASAVRDAPAHLAAAVAAFWLYYSLLESSPWQATFGKRALGIMVVDSHTKARIGFSRASARYLVSCISKAALGLGYLLGALPRRKRTLHDIICRTRVIHGKTS